MFRWGTPYPTHNPHMCISALKHEGENEKAIYQEPPLASQRQQQHQNQLDRSMPSLTERCSLSTGAHTHSATLSLSGSLPQPRLPIHLRPEAEIWKPSGHRQVKLPSVLEQVPKVQISGNWEHSSISEDGEEGRQPFHRSLITIRAIIFLSRCP